MLKKMYEKKNKKIKQSNNKITVKQNKKLNHLLKI